MARGGKRKVRSGERGRETEKAFLACVSPRMGNEEEREDESERAKYSEM